MHLQPSAKRALRKWTRLLSLASPSTSMYRLEREEGVTCVLETPVAPPVGCALACCCCGGCLALTEISTLTGFLNPALTSCTTSAVCVAEKRPVRRCRGRRCRIELRVASKPISRRPEGKGARVCTGGRRHAMDAGSGLEIGLGGGCEAVRLCGCEAVRL